MANLFNNLIWQWNIPPQTLLDDNTDGDNDNKNNGKNDIDDYNVSAVDDDNNDDANEISVNLYWSNWFKHI